VENSIEIVDQIGKACEEVGIGCRLAIAGARFEPEDGVQLVAALREVLKCAEALENDLMSSDEKTHDGKTLPPFVVRPVAMDAVIREHLRTTLEQYGWNISQAAIALELDRRTVYRMIQRYRLPSGK